MIFILLSVNPKEIIERKKKQHPGSQELILTVTSLQKSSYPKRIGIKD